VDTLNGHVFMANLVLIVTDRPGDASNLQQLLALARDGPFSTEWVRSLHEALYRIGADGIDIILLDFLLPDSQGIQTFDSVFAAASPVPVVTLVSDDGIELAREAVQRGAQGYLLRGHFQNELVPQALRNTIERKLVEDALFVEKERAAVTLDSIGDAVISTDCSGDITYINVAAERMTGWTRQQATGHPVANVLHLIDRVTRARTGNPVSTVILEGKPLELSANWLLIRPDGQEISIENSTAPIYDRRGKATGAVIIFRNIGPSQAAMAEQMTYLAHHDALTGLPNRILLNDRLAIAIALAKRNGTSLGVLFLDLDNFKHINDSLGHAVGDQLLKSVAHRLRSCIRASDTVSRYGGDEFLMLLAEDKKAEDAAQIAQKIIGALALPHSILQHEFHTTASIGISTYPSDGHDVDTLVQNADTAMYCAKKNGGNSYEFFNVEMNRRAVERQVIEADLRRALRSQELVLQYQPKVNLRTGMITSVEALIRWRHPRRGLMWPQQFVAIAEECGLILPMGRWVLNEACKQARAWSAAGLASISVAVNVSALEFRSHDFLPGIHRVLTETGLTPDLLELELTEGLLMPNSTYTREMLYKLKEMGVRLAIDDFGTGYSSLNYLQEFPIDVLKIDQSFVQGITEAKGKRIIVTAVIGMGTNLMHRVVAEGIETRGQFAFLSSQGCEEGQGYYFSPPLSAARCTRLLAKGISKGLIS
jgi:diguanylate cyclase (GGDEF)-like protein/PAS domain S-box-containing protein